MEYAVELLQKNELNPETKSFRFTRPSGFIFEAGQYFILTLDDNLKKPFSFSNSPTEKDYIEFTTKISISEFKKSLDSLKIGDKVKIEGPMGEFTYKPSLKKVTFLAGGIGITPFRSICKHLADMKIDCDVVLVWGNRTLDDIIFKEDFEDMATKNPNLKVVHVPETPPPNWLGCSGFICKNHLTMHIPDYSERTYYVCGPPKMIEAMNKLLNELQISKEKIIVEQFSGY